MPSVESRGLSDRHGGNCDCGCEKVGRLVGAAKWVDEQGDAGGSSAGDGRAVFNGAHGVDEGMLIGSRAAAKPRVIGDVDQHTRPSRHVLTHQIGKDGLKAYKHGKGLLGMGKNRVFRAACKFGRAEVAGQAGPVDVAQQGNGVSVGRPLAKGH